MADKLPNSLNGETADQLCKRWEAAGYEFKGNGSLQRDDPCYCPYCGEPGYFYALWQHPTLKQGDIGDDGQTYTWPDSKSFNRCYECGYEWDSDWFE